MGGERSGKMGERAEAEKYKKCLSKSYQEFCKKDSDVRIFDGNLQKLTKRVIDAFGNGFQVHGRLLGSLKEVTTGLQEIDQQVVTVIHAYTTDIQNTPELNMFVRECFHNNLGILNSFTDLEDCLRKAWDSLDIMQNALQHFPAEGNLPPTKEESQKVLEVLKQFQSAWSPFPDNFSSRFESLYNLQKDMLDRIDTRLSKLDKKLKHVTAWRKISKFIFVATFGAVLICSVVAAAMAAPPVAAAFGAAAAIPIGSVGSWVNSLLKKYQNNIKRERKVIKSMASEENNEANKDLGTITHLVKSLEVTISSMMRTVSLTSCPTDSKRFLVVMERIKKEEERLMQEIDHLLKQVDKCRRIMIEARKTVDQNLNPPIVYKMMKEAPKHGVSSVSGNAHSGSVLMQETPDVRRDHFKK